MGLIWWTLGFANVYLGEWKQTQVAIKVCKDVDNIDTFLKEALILA
jgi:predicted Ser/Thr protein kinase